MRKIGPRELYKMALDIEIQAPTQAINRPTQSDFVVSVEKITPENREKFAPKGEPVTSVDERPVC